jgi:hypothetical protein
LGGRRGKSSAETKLKMIYFIFLNFDFANIGFAAKPGMPDYPLAQHTITGIIYQNTIKYTNRLQNIPNGHK